MIGYIGNETDLSLPNDFKGKSYIIGSNAFSGRSDLTSVIIGSSVTSIGSSAFENCANLTSVTIGRSVTWMGREAFYNCGSLKKAEFASIEAMCKIDYESYTANPLRLANHIYVDGQEVTDVVIPESVTEIKDYTFYNCNYITSVSIPNSVKRIGECSFSSCLKLRSLVVPNSVESIGDAAFYNCKFTSVLFGDDLVMIEGNIFDSRAKISKNLVCMSVIPPASKNDICYNDEIYANTQLLVPEESVELYKTANYWKKFQNIKGFVGEPFVMGDADGDGKLTKEDVSMVMQYFIGKDTDIEPLAADVNGDAKVTMADANILANYFQGKTLNIKLNKKSLSLSVDESETLTAEVTQINPTDNPCTWSTSDASVATVDSNGRVTGIKEGKAIITCTANDVSGVKAECVVKVVEQKDQTLENWTSTNAGKSGSSDSHTWTFASDEGSVLSFDYMVSSESGYDYLTITLDGSEIVKASGEKSSSYVKIFTSAGLHTLKATYSKDSSGNSGSDKASLTNIKVIQ